MENSEDEKIPGVDIPPPSGGGGGGGLVGYAKMLLPALLVLALVWSQSGNYVKIEDAKVNDQGTANEITALKSSIASLNALSGQISKIDSSITSINSKISSLEASDRNFVTSDRISALQSAISTLQTDINTIKNAIPAVTSLTEKVTALEATLKTVNDTLTSHWSAIVAVQDNLTGLSARFPAATSPTTSTVGGSSSTLNNLTATIYAPISFGSNLPITSLSVSGDTSTSNWFQLQLNNATGKTLNNIQLAIGLALVDINGNPIQNSPVTLQSSASDNKSVMIALTTSGGGISWAYQSMMPPNIVVFSNSSASSYFGFGTLSMSTSTMTLTIYINITPYNVSQQALNFYPIVKVLGYS